MVFISTGEETVRSRSLVAVVEGRSFWFEELESSPTILRKNPLFLVFNPGVEELLLGAKVDPSTPILLSDGSIGEFLAAATLLLASSKEINSYPGPADGILLFEPVGEGKGKLEVEGDKELVEGEVIILGNCAVVLSLKGERWGGVIGELIDFIEIFVVEGDEFGDEFSE